MLQVTGAAVFTWVGFTGSSLCGVMGFEDWIKSQQQYIRKVNKKKMYNYYFVFTIRLCVMVIYGSPGYN